MLKATEEKEVWREKMVTDAAKLWECSDVLSVLFCVVLRCIGDLKHTLYIKELVATVTYSRSCVIYN